MSNSNDVEGRIDEAAEKVSEYQEGLEQFVIERPLTALGISFAVGLLLARIMF